MESVFSRFDSYDFESDRRFQDGLKSLSSNNTDESKQLDLKLFFYNRFVEPIDPTNYKQKSSSSSRLIASVDVQQLDRWTSSDPDSDISENQTSETSAEMEVKPLSFAEVMKLVQEGKEVPGVKKLDIKPTNQSPTPSHMDRILKPWELSSVSK